MSGMNDTDSAPYFSLLFTCLVMQNHPSHKESTMSETGSVYVPPIRLTLSVSLEIEGLSDEIAETIAKAVADAF
jgi:hypothetical protein